MFPFESNFLFTGEKEEMEQEKQKFLHPAQSDSFDEEEEQHGSDEELLVDELPIPKKRINAKTNKAKKRKKDR